MTKKKAGKTSIPKTETALIKQVIENNVSLQQKSVDLVITMNDLVKRIDKLVNLFEEASKHIAEVTGEDTVKQLSLKLQELLEQNKDIARGLILLEQYVRSKSGYRESELRP